jgi:hypothetical protein
VKKKGERKGNKKTNQKKVGEGNKKTEIQKRRIKRKKLT